MSRSLVGVSLALLFVLLESAQFVFFGGLFQKLDSFLFGFLVFGFTAISFILLTAIRAPEQIRSALTLPKQLIAINIGAVVTFTAYLLSVQLLEPAITYTISSGVMPVTAWLLFRFGIREGHGMRNSAECWGTVLIVAGLIFLTAATLIGMTGFVRGGWPVALLGIALAMVDGVFFTLILVYSQRMDKAGIGPSAVLGLRMPLYVVVTGFIAFQGTAREIEMNGIEIAGYAALGFLVTVPPLYFLQKAVSMISTMTLSTLTALGPLVIFLLQLVEGRVDYSSATLVGLLVYIVGAIVASIGSVKASADKTPQQN